MRGGGGAVGVESGAAAPLLATQRGRRHHLRVDEQEDARSGEADDGGEEEAGFGAVDEVPEGGVGEGEGQ